MFGWFGSRKRKAPVPAPSRLGESVWSESALAADSVPAQSFAAGPQQEAAPAVVQPHPDLAMTVPAALREMAETMPASLEMLADAGAAARAMPDYSPLSWMLSAAPPQDRPRLSEAESDLLARLDAVLDAPALPANLLPRMPAVIPQLMALLRREDSSRADVVRQLSKDVLLTAEVLRVARSPTYGTAPVERLEDALDRIGSFGLASAMTRVLMKPVFQANGGLARRAAPRIWQFAESKSMFCAELAARHGDRFEGFLAGLMHDTGWLVLLRLIDRMGVPLSLPVSSALDAELALRKDRLFGRLTADWGLTPGITALSLRFASGGGAVSQDRLDLALQQSDRLCLAHIEKNI